jgi:hypothetical protein
MQVDGLLTGIDDASQNYILVLFAGAKRSGQQVCSLIADFRPVATILAVVYIVLK